VNPERPIPRFVAACLTLVCVLAPAAVGQGAIDPNVAPRAAAMERAGDRMAATELLGSYLATAPGDGRAWFQFGRMYLLAARDWHETGHTGDPDGALYLDLAAIAFDHAVNLQVDSGRIFRGAVEMERDLIRMERTGWSALRAESPRRDPAPVPAFIAELGANLLNSCPANAVLISGNELETLASWVAAVGMGYRADVFPLLWNRLQTDSLYRRQATFSLGVQDTADPASMMRAMVARRPLCLTPFADTMVAAPGPWVVTRLAIVTGPDTSPTSDVLTISQFLSSQRHRSTTWTHAVSRIYLQAARRNLLLCGGLLAYLSDPAYPACGQ
jgi:hypothetical protein